jgi:hypothetical protein
MEPVLGSRWPEVNTRSTNKQAAHPKGGFQITSLVDKRYNCIAYAAGDTANWWWPLPADVTEVFWPAGAPRTETLAAFRAALASVGFVECENGDFDVPDADMVPAPVA